MSTKVTEIDRATGSLSVKTYDDQSVAIENENGVFFLDDNNERRKVARALSPVYIIKSNSGYGALGNFWFEFQWQPEQKQAVRFTSKKQAKDFADCFASEINPRVVRLK